jgi:DNA-binding transcriptional ArsR family regulator
VPADERPKPEPLTDARTIRALAHPLRLRILDVLGEHGPLTATQISERVDESPANCSFHLRTLARYGYVEDAGGGAGRNRPWKLASRATYFSPVDAAPDTLDAINAAQAAIDAAHQERVRTWRRRAPSAPKIWQQKTFEMSYETWLTPDEVAQVSAAISGAIEQIMNGRTKQPDEARVLIHASAFPVSEHLPDSPDPSVTASDPGGPDNTDPNTPEDVR